MAVTNIGKAVFDLGVDSSQFVQGITEMNSNVASFANKTTGGFAKTSSAFKSLDDGVFNASKGFERLTRGIRDTDPAMSKANEWLYTYRQSLDRMAQQIDTTKQRLEQQNVAYVQSEQRLKTQVANITALIARQQELKVSYLNAKAALDAYSQSSNASQAKIDSMKARVDTLGASWLRQIQVVESAKTRLDTMKESHKTYAETINLTKERLESMNETEKRLGNAYDLQKEKISTLKQKFKDKQAATENDSRATQKNATVIQQAGNSWSLFGGKINLVIGSYNKITSVAKAATGAVVASTSKIGSVMTVAFGTVLGTALNGAAGSVQGFVQSGLDAYTSFERLNASLKQLVATEMRTKDPTMSMTDALGKAGVESEKLIAWTQQLAVDSPFSQEGVANAFQMAKALGFNVDESKRLTVTLTDWASATGKSEDAMQRIALALGQIHAKGKLAGGEMMQLTEAGLPATEILAKAFHKTTQEVIQMQEDGLIPAQDAIAALADSLDNDFGGAAKRQSQTMTGLLNSMQDLTTVNLREFFTGTFEAIQPYLIDFVNLMSDPSVTASIKEIGGALGSAIGGAFAFLKNIAIPGFIAGFNLIVPTLQEALAYIIAFGQDAYSWGSDLMSQYGNGIIDAAGAVLHAIMSIASTIMEWMMPNSPPKFLPHIDDWGRETAQVYFDSFGDADFKAIEDVGKKVEDLLSGMEAGGELGKGFNVASAVLGNKQAMVAATMEFKRFGQVTQATLARIRETGGPVGDMMADYVTKLFAATKADQELAKAQDYLNNITAVYDQRLGKIDARMKALQGKQAAKDTQKQIDLLKHNIENASKLPVGLRPDIEKLQNELEQAQLQKDRDAVEQEKDTATAIAQVQVDSAKQASDLANAELTQRQNQIDLQQQYIDLMKQQIELEQKAKEERDKSSKADDKEAKKAEAAAKKEAAEAKKVADAQFAAQMASADATEQVNLLQEKLSSLTPGTAEYYQVQKQLIQAQQKLTTEQQKQNKVDLEASLIGKDKNEQIAIYQDYLSTLTPGTAEYTAAQKKLTELQGQVAKSTDQVTDAEWQANFASKDRAGQIEMLKEKLGGLKEGTKEYYDTLKQLNSLEKAEANAGGKKKKGKDGTPNAGSLYKNPIGKVIDDASKMGDKIITIGERLKAFFEPINARAKDLGDIFGKVKGAFDKAGGTFDRFKGILGALGGTLTVILVHQFWSQILVWVEYLKPLVAIFQALLSPVGLLVIGAALLGAAWATNFGGIRDIAAKAWEKIGPIFNDLMFDIKVIVKAFQNGGIESGFKRLFQFLPQIGDKITEIFQVIMEGIGKFFSSEDMQVLIANIGILLQRIGAWMLTTGIPLLLRIFGGLWGAIAAAAIQYGPTLLAAISKLIGQLGSTIQTKAAEQGPKIVHGIQDWLKNIGKTIKNNLPFVRAGVSLLLVGLAQGLTSILVTVLPYFQDAMSTLLTYLIPGIPDVISEFATMLMSLGLWLIESGVPMIGKFLGDSITKGMNTISAILPSLGLNIGRLLGSTLTKIVVLAIDLIRNLPAWIGALGTWLWNSFLPALGNLLIAVWRGAVGIVLGILVGIWEPIAQTASAVMTDLGLKIMSALGISIDSNSALYLQSIITSFNGAMTWIKEFLGIEGEGGASQKFNEIGKGIMTGLKAGYDGLIAIIDAGIIVFLDGIATLFGTNKETLVKTVYDLYTAVTGWWNTIKADTVTIVSDLIIGASKLFTDFKNDALRIIGDLWAGMVGAGSWFDKIKADLFALVGEIVLVLTGNAGHFPQLRDKALQVVRDLWDGLVGATGWFTKVKADVIKLIDELKTNALRIFGEVLKNIRQFGSDMWEGLLGKDGWATKLASGFTDKIGDILGDAKKKFDSFKEWLGNGVTGFGKMLYDGALLAGDFLLQGFKNAIENQWESLKGWLADKFGRWFDNWFGAKKDSEEGGGGGGGGGGGYAVGTEYSSGQKTWVGEHGPELVTLPRGSQVKTNTNSMRFFDDVAKKMAYQMETMVQSTMQSMDRMATHAGNQVGAAAAQFHTNTTSNETNTSDSTTKNERHDHYNLTIVSQARKEDLTQDFNTMMSLAGAVS